LHRPRPRQWSLSKSLECIEQMQSAKLLGVILQSTFSFVDHQPNYLELYYRVPSVSLTMFLYSQDMYSQRVYLLKQLRDQGLPLQKLHTVFQAIVLSRLMYALPAWAVGGPFIPVTHM